ncbi:protein of unknown function [Taphrina deformans PYCC 5710]|uniref:Uncharacterized protein n=1 Tax=Taphrina deformans (strain PYCC 5710 / ATCC 11124 / CBS 356.35 / IMI 108563 / JCM 9778 / NBRC 8474) TaxID=1097556 RepID=S0BE41_TAPDE|nr:protein of unknown function [Taphrina deformans PYCC 5710]|eukprot:CCG81548.1 protein of unknown function [Taphrina deformans PYCC 5710]
MNHTTSNLYVSRSQVSDEVMRRTADPKAVEILGLKDDSHWRPVFGTLEEGSNIRRLYPAKTKGRTHLAAVSSSRTNMLYRPRSCSNSSVESHLDDENLLNVDVKCHTSPFAKQFDQQKGVDKVPVIGALAERGPGPDVSGHCRSVSEDTTYGTMNKADFPPIHEKDVTPDQNPSLSASTISCMPTNGSSRASFQPYTSRPQVGYRQTSASSMSKVLPSNGRAKGHNRNESVVSIWTVDSSPESARSSPPLNRRKPLPLQFRPPMPDFDTGMATAPPGRSFDILHDEPNSSSIEGSTAKRPPIPPRTSSRQSSNNSDRRRSMPASHHMLKTMSQPSESWDDDFGGLDLHVPASVRQAQNTVRGHLSQFRQFSELIAELKRLRIKQLQRPSQRLPEDHQFWRELDGLVAISSRGEQVTEHEQRRQQVPVEDETVSQILGQVRRDGRKVRLDERLLTNLIEKAYYLVEDIKEVTRDEGL